MRRLSSFFIILIWSLLLVVLVFGLTGFLTISNQGKIKAVGINVYKDSVCTQALTVIDWGVVDVGQTKTYEAWLRNEGNVAVTVSMSLSDWNPSASSSALSVTWDSQNVRIEAGTVKQVVFSLSVLNNAVTNFAFNINLVGSET